MQLIFYRKNDLLAEAASNRGNVLVHNEEV
jgi:hypothetical protein